MTKPNSLDGVAIVEALDRQTAVLQRIDQKLDAIGRELAGRTDDTRTETHS